MNDKFPRTLRQLLISLGPYVTFGIMIACIVGLLILSWYILLWGLMIGFVLWMYTLIKRYLYPEKPQTKNTKGRIIEHDKHH